MRQRLVRAENVDQSGEGVTAFRKESFRMSGIHDKREMKRGRAARVLEFHALREARVSPARPRYFFGFGIGNGNQPDGASLSDVLEAFLSRLIVRFHGGGN